VHRLRSISIGFTCSKKHLTFLPQLCPPASEREHCLRKRVQLEVRYKGGQVKVAEQIALARADRLGDLVSLLGISPQLLHLRREDRVAAIEVGVTGPCAEDLGGVVLQHAPKELGKDLHAVRVDQLGAR
jgi:hypothetical protein